MADSRLSFGAANVSQGRVFWRGVWSSLITYNLNDAVSFGGSAYIALATSLNVAPTVTTSWDVMTSSGSVTSVAGRVGVVTLSSADLTDKDSASGVAGLDSGGFLKASECTININAQTGTTYTIVSGDRGKLVTISNAASVAVAVPQATGSFASGFYCEVENIGAGTVTLTPTTSTIDGAASLTLKQFQSVTLVSNGTNWICLRSKPIIAATTAVSHQFITAIAADGTGTLAQPVITDLAVGTSANIAAIVSDETGTGALVFATSPTLVTPALGVATATSINGNTVPSASDTVALLAATQTFSGKTLQGAASGNKVTLLNSQDTLSNLVGTGSAQTVYTFTIPANTIQAGKGFRITYKGLSGSATAITYAVVIGATTVATWTTSAGTNNHRISCDVFNNAATQAAQVTTTFAFDGTTIVANTEATAAENFVNAVTVKITASETAASTLKPTKWFVELIQ